MVIKFEAINLNGKSRSELIDILYNVYLDLDESSEVESIVDKYVDSSLENNSVQQWEEGMFGLISDKNLINIANDLKKYIINNQPQYKESFEELGLSLKIVEE